MSNYPIKNFILGLAGAVVGGGLGILICKWLFTQDMYGTFIPGAFIGLGFGLAARTKRIEFGVICGFLGLVGILLAEWYTFVPKLSFTEFLEWYGGRPVKTWIYLTVGIIMAFWFGIGREKSGREKNGNPRPEKND